MFNRTRGETSRSKGASTSKATSSRLRVKTMRIKKIYFDRILSKEKKVEYRDAKEYYSFLELERIDAILFHYQTSARLVVEVKKIEKIQTPEKLKLSKIPFGPNVYAIHLGRVLSSKE